MTKTIISAIQAAPVYFNKDASLSKAIRLIHAAAAEGACLAAFGETWLPGYPFFVYSAPTALRWDAAQAYLGEAVVIPGPEVDLLCEAARSAGIDVMIGVAELDEHTRGTVYCTMLAIGRDGTILGKHRKLKPTMEERAIWGEGRGDDLFVYERPYARISALNCWEHQMVLPGYALMAQGTQIHIAAWPMGEPDVPPEPPDSFWSRQELLSRSFASQDACYVLAVGGLLNPADVSERYREMAYNTSGASFVVDPRGEVVARSKRGIETILTYEIDPAVIRSAKVALDVAGHYSRRDVFELTVCGKSVFNLCPLPHHE